MSVENPPAFPMVVPTEFQFANNGMTLRDWYAGQAIGRVIDAYIVGNGPCLGTEHMPANCAIHAYRIADAMLAARTGASS